MTFPDPASFFKAMGVDMFIILIIGGIIYWVTVMVKKINPNFKFWLKYKVLKRKHNESEVSLLLENLDNGVSNDELVQNLILGNKTSPIKAKELLFIYKELKKMKGGMKNE